MSDIDQTLAGRKKTHGSFKEHAGVAQALKDSLRGHAGWCELTWEQREAVDMICHKLARIIAGNPNEPDHWHDIIGYARLVEKAISHEEI